MLNLWSKIVVDDTLPFLPTGQLFGVSTGNKCALWPALLEKAVRVGSSYIATTW